VDGTLPLATPSAPLEPAQAALIEAAGAGGTSLEPLGVDGARAQALAIAAAAPPGPEVRFVEDLRIAGPAGPIAVRRYRHAARPAGRAVYLHSGGWVLGGLETCDHIVRHLARRTGLEYWSVDYRLAPEHPAPAALDDARTVLRHVAGLGSPVVLHGDSAGGALAALLSQEDDAAVTAVLRLTVLLYPVTDADFTRTSYRTHGAGGVLTASDMRWFWSLYAPGRELTSPDLSPLRGAVSAASPTLVVLAGHDPLHDEGRAYAAALAAQGRLVAVHDFADCTHSFVSLAGRNRRADECLGVVADAVRRAVAAP
jgi:acetyl esterase